MRPSDRGLSGILRPQTRQARTAGGEPGNPSFLQSGSAPPDTYSKRLNPKRGGTLSAGRLKRPRTYGSGNFPRISQFKCWAHVGAGAVGECHHETMPPKRKGSAE